MTDSKRGQEPLASAALEDPVFVARLREHMVKFARLQMGDQHLAEDAVQEAGAPSSWASASRRFAGGRRFSGRVSFSTAAVGLW
jgi:DNA-directed RNA polymerase specialized sigma24 family protein